MQLQLTNNKLLFILNSLIVRLKYFGKDKKHLQTSKWYENDIS